MENNGVSMKKRVLLLIVFTMLALLSGCGKNKAEIALITDVGTIEDGSYNQGAWEGIKKYGDEHEVGYAYYKPREAALDSYNEAIKKAVKKGAKVIVCPGYLPEEAVYYAQNDYPKVDFILLDGAVHNHDYTDFTIKANVMQISFAEEQAGFLAGYAAVRDGYTRLGFIGGEAEDAVIRFGYGFVQGADYAAIELGTQVDMKYTYAGTYYESSAVNSMASEWYQTGTQVIFACGGAMGRSVMKAAEALDCKVIGVDVDQSSESPSVITSSLKNLSGAVYQGIDDYYNGSFKGGFTSNMTAQNNGIGLVMDNAKFNLFTENEYRNILSLMSNNSIIPYSGTDIGTCDDIMLINTSVTFIKQ